MTNHLGHPLGHTAQRVALKHNGSRRYGLVPCFLTIATCCEGQQTPKVDVNEWLFAAQSGLSFPGGNGQRVKTRSPRGMIINVVLTLMHLELLQYAPLASWPLESQPSGPMVSVHSQAQLFAPLASWLPESQPS